MHNTHILKPWTCTIVFYISGEILRAAVFSEQPEGRNIKLLDVGYIAISSKCIIHSNKHCSV